MHSPNVHAAVTFVTHPDWTSIMTAFGTVGAVVVAVGIAIWSERNINCRTKEERERSDKLLADEHARSERLLAEERASSAQRVADERAYGEARLQEERRLTREQEKLAEARSVEVVGARMTAESSGTGAVSSPDDPSECPVVVVINHGRYTITRVDAQFSIAGGVYPRRRAQGYTDFQHLPRLLAHDLSAPLTQIETGVLACGGAVRFIGGAVAVRHLHAAFPVVRWTDRWGTRWQHKQGDVQQIEESAPWPSS